MVISPDLKEASDQPLPVLYLLHGASDDFSKWANTVPEIKDLADRYQMIIVCPDGGYTSWYFDSPIDENFKYETYIVKELIPAIDDQFNTEAKPEGRAITGHSMGGHGAFYLSFRNPGIWGAAGSMSGGLDIRPFPGNWDLDKRLGELKTSKENWENYTVHNLVYLLKPNQLKLIMDCGTGDFFYEVNQNFHEKLLLRKIPHEYIQRPGEHNWTYWKNAIKYQIMFFDDFFQNSLNTKN